MRVATRDLSGGGDGGVPASRDRGLGHHAAYPRHVSGCLGRSLDAAAAGVLAKAETQALFLSAPEPSCTALCTERGTLAELSRRDRGRAVGRPL